MDFTQDEFIGVAKQAVLSAGGQTAFSKQTGIPQGHLSAALSGGSIPPGLLETLDFERVVVFRPKT